MKMRLKLELRSEWSSRFWTSLARFSCKVAWGENAKLVAGEPQAELRRQGAATCASILILYSARNQEKIFVIGKLFSTLPSIDSTGFWFY